MDEEKTTYATYAEQLLQLEQRNYALAQRLKAQREQITTYRSLLHTLAANCWVDSAIFQQCVFCTTHDDDYHEATCLVVQVWSALAKEKREEGTV